MTPAAAAAKRALSAHDMDVDSWAAWRIADVAATGDVQATADQLDREALGMAGHDETQAAARDVVAAVKAVTT